jgi:hypothetical protein
MVSLVRKYRLSGMLPQDDLIHMAVMVDAGEIAPVYVEVPGGRKVPQYSPTVIGTSIAYDPAGDCDGNLMSYKFQTNNNCYNYACNIATNSFTQPGRMHGLFLSDSPQGPTGAQVVKGAELDGLVKIGGSEISVPQLKHHLGTNLEGHFVALLTSEADISVKWPGGLPLGEM